MNTVTLLGRLGKDPETSATSSGTFIAKVSIAVPRSKDATDWIRITAFGDTADFLHKYFHKGDRIIVHGRLQVSNYEAKDGTRRESYEVVASQFEFVDSKKKSEEFIDVGDDDEGFPF